MLTMSVSIALGIVFAVVLVVLRNQALERRFTELQRCVRQVAREYKGPDSLTEEHEDFPEIDFVVYKSTGGLLASTTKTAIPTSAGRSKVEHRLYYGDSNVDILVIGTTSWSETEAGLQQLAWVLAGLWFALVFVTAGVTWYAGGLILRPVTELVRSADQLSSKSETGLLETSDQAEFATLTESLNQLIVRVRRSAQLQEQFAADAAHELRSPLALLRTRIETTLLNARSPDQYQEDLRSMLPKIDRLTSIVETLLASARDSRADASVIDLESALRQVVAQWSLDFGWIPGQLNLETTHCQARINFEELRIVVVNLLDNAAKHSPVDQSVAVHLVLVDAMARLSVHNFGISMSAEDRAHAFERFYRSDDDRSRDAGGAGIGLSVVRRIIENRGGQVGFAEPGSGTEVFALIPVL